MLPGDLELLENIDQVGVVPQSIFGQRRPVVGAKLVADYAFNTPDHPDRLDLHDPGSVAFWVFWITMLICFVVGALFGWLAFLRNEGGGR